MSKINDDSNDQTTGDSAETESTCFPWQSPSSRSFDDVGGLDSIKEQLERLVVRPLIENREEYARLNVTVPNVLLYGPPGTGKTYLTEALVGEIGYPFVKITPSIVQSRFVNESAERVRDLFTEAREIAEQYGHAVIFIDEVDVVLGSRDMANAHHEDQKVVNEFLTFLEESGQQNVYVVAATNRRERLDEAAVRAGRFDREFHIGIPGAETRREIFRTHLEGRPNTVSDDDLTWCVENTEKWNGAEIAITIDEAARRAVERGGDTIQHEDLVDAIIDQTSERVPSNIPL
jgi:SpoVK/Ycf46/Vps4 family AAA+-type ATPase